MQLVVKVAWSIIPVSVGMTVWVMTQLYAVEDRVKKYSDQNDKDIITLLKDGNAQTIKAIEKLDNKIDKNQDMIVDEIKRNRKKRD